MKDVVRNRYWFSSLTSVVAAVSTAIYLFFTFRIAVNYVSTVIVGCWALLQGFFIVARIADSGIGSNITRVVARGRVNGDSISVYVILSAACGISTIPIIVLSAIIYYPAVTYVVYRYGNQVTVGDVRILAMYCLIFSGLTSIATNILAGIEGGGRLVIKNTIIFTVNVLSTLTCPYFIKAFGTSGIGFVYSFNAAMQVAVSLGMLIFVERKSAHCVKMSVWDAVKNMWEENYKLTIVGLLRLSFEPITKLYLSFGSPLGVIASFDLALRFSTQARILVQSSLQPLLLLGAQSAKESQVDTLQKFHSIEEKLAKILFSLFECQIAASVILSIIGFGKYDAHFVGFYAVLAFANSINIVGVPGYIFCMATGNVTPLVRIQIYMALINAVLGGVCAVALGSATGIVLSYAISFAYGGVSCLFLFRNVLRNAGILFRVVDLSLFQILRTVIWLSLTLTIVLCPEYISLKMLIGGSSIAIVISGVLFVWEAKQLFVRRGVI